MEVEVLRTVEAGMQAAEAAVPHMAAVVAVETTAVADIIEIDFPPRHPVSVLYASDTL